MADSTQRIPTPATPQPTPGPWNVDWFNPSEQGERRAWRILDAREVDEFSEADVNLIAAAPDLLAACEAFLNPELRASHVTRLVSDAIAKARGNQ